MSNGQAPMASEIIVSLGNDLRISRAAEIFDKLMAAADSSRTIIIDGGDVGKIDAAGLQAVTAAIMRFRIAGLQWRWHNEPLSLRSAAKMLGLTDVLGLPS